MIEALRHTYRTLFSKLTLLIWVLSTIGTVMAGPFGTFATMRLGERLLYWPALTTTSIILGYAGYATARMIFGVEETLRLHLAGSLSGTFWVSIDVWLISWFMIDDPMLRPEFTSLLIYVGFVFACVALGRMVLLSLLETASRAGSREASDTAEVEAARDVTMEQKAEPRKPRLCSRLPHDLPPPILRVSADDHQVAVVTANGTITLRMRLRDAIAELDEIEGFLAHRSHWVARVAIADVEREGGRVFLILTNGDRVPVGRKYRPDLEAANIIASPNAA